jgi:type I restriction enzyme S subunit
MTPEQLKASILQYAMEGKLVKQDPNDESASELLQKIENEKAKLVKEGKINKERAVRPVKEEEKDGVLPTGWTYTRFQNISLFTTDYVANGSFKTLREHTHKYKEKNYALFVRTMDLSANFKSNLTYIDKDSYDFLSKSKLFGGELILPNIGGSIGKAFLMPNLNMPMSLAPNSIMVKFTEQVMNKYFSYFIQSPMGKSLLLNNKGGTATPKFSKTELRNMVLKLPPLEEQKRIVAKIEKLMPLVDEYAESYNRLQKIDNEFEDKLKQSVLQYAMEGKLVKQNPSDEPASELVKASSMEKSHNGSYKIPSSWEWVRLGSGVKFINGRAYKKTELLTDSNLTPVLRVGNLFTNSSWYYSDLKLDEDKYIDNGDLIYAWSASFGPRIWNGGHVIYHYHIWKTVIKKSIDKKFLYYFLSDPHNVLGETKLHGSTMKHVTKTNMEKLPFPLPPLEEQKRIVAKIEKIMNSINNH